MNSVQSPGGLNFQMCVISSFTGWNTYNELPQGFSVNYGDILGISAGCFHISWFNYLKRNIKIVEFVCETNYCKVQ